MPQTIVTRNAQLAQGLQLGQLRPANTTAASLYSPADGIVTVITQIIVCNTSAGSAKYRICHDEDGTTYDETTALFWDVPLATETTDILSVTLYMTDNSGNISVRTDTNSALTFTCYGEETQVRAR